MWQARWTVSLFALVSLTRMSGEPRNVRRPYRQVARAAAAEERRERILDAAEELLRGAPVEAVGLEAVAAAAGTTVPTVLRHFGGKDALVAATLAAALARTRATRPRPALGDAAGAAEVLAREYEDDAPLLRAAATLPDARRALETPRRLHGDWLARTFAPGLSPLPPLVHRRRLAQLVAVSQPATWRTLREDQGLGPAQARAALAELLRPFAPRRQG